MVFGSSFLGTSGSPKRSSSAFTLTELIVVVGIIATLAMIGGMASITVSRRAQAARIISDVRKIENAWLEWRSDTHLPFPAETTPGFSSSNSYCDPSPEPFVETTSLYQNIPSSSNWRGPYLTRTMRDPYNKAYLYDFDTTSTYVSGNCASYSGGVNVAIQFCPDDRGDYRQILPVIDQAIDGQVDRCAGKFRWTDPNIVNSHYGMYYLLDDNN